MPLSSCAEAARGGVAVQRFVTSWGVAVTLSEDMMSDDQCIPNLIEIASDSYQLQTAQHVAAKKLLDYDGEIFPQDGCAITLSVLLQEAGIAVPDIYRAIDLGDQLKTERNWQVISIGEQQAGDVGSTCGVEPNHGSDHVYLVLKVLNSDEMVIADNQALTPHFRYVSGIGGKTPTKFFLRAANGSPLVS